MRLFTITALAAILLVRMGSIDIAKPDRVGMLAAVGEMKDYQASMLDENRDVWHEIGLLSTSLGSPMRRLFDYDDIVDQLDDGGTVILSDGQTDRFRHTLDYAYQSEGKKLEWKPWKRFKRRQKIPFKEVLLQGRDSIPEFDSMMSREYEVVRVVKKIDLFNRPH